MPFSKLLILMFAFPGFPLGSLDRGMQFLHGVIAQSRFAISPPAQRPSSRAKT
jgi:hypothetical protein